MKPLPSPEETAASLVSEKLLNFKIQRLFLERNREGRISFLLHHLIGPETERYAAEPVYSVTGKGFLKSKGDEGIREEEELEAFLRGEEGRDYVNKTLALIDEKISERPSDSGR